MPQSAPARATAVNVPTTSLTSVLTISNIQGTSANTTFQFVADVTPSYVISGVANFTAGTAATAVAISCVDQGGTQVGTTQTVTVAAGSSYNLAFEFTDLRGLQVSPSAYTIRLQQTAATGNGTVNEIVACVEVPG